MVVPQGVSEDKTGKGVECQSDEEGEECIHGSQVYGLKVGDVFPESRINAPS